MQNLTPLVVYSGDEVDDIVERIIIIVERVGITGDFLASWRHRVIDGDLDFLCRVPNSPTSQVLKRRPTGRSKREEGTRLD